MVNMDKLILTSLRLALMSFAFGALMTSGSATAAPSKPLPVRSAKAKPKPTAKVPASAKSSPSAGVKSGKTAATSFDGGIIGGKGHKYHLTTPAGWLMDTKAGIVGGIPVIFTPLNAPGPEYPTVLYSQIMQRKGRSLDELVQGMVNMMKPGAVMADDFVQPPIKLGEGRQAIVRKLPAGADGNHELVAFIEERDWLVLIILAADTDADAARVRPAFEDLVQSYSFGADKVKLEE